MAKEMTEAQMVGLVRNALLVAGYEMGQTGDHWPVINDVVHKIAAEWQESEIQRNVDEVLKEQLKQQIEILENELPKCAAGVRAALQPKLNDFKEAYDAYFMPLDEKIVAPVSSDDMPDYIKRAEVIISSLGGDNA